METAALTSEQSMIKITAPPLPRSRSLAKRSVLAGFPSFVKPSAGAKHRTMPVKALSSSSRLTVTRPRAGSFNTALFFLNPQSTTKWLKFQCRITGKSHFRRSSVSMRYPAASRE